MDACTLEEDDDPCVADRQLDLSQTSDLQQTKEECIRTQNPFTFKYKYQRARQRHNKSFIVTSCSTMNPQA
jgi:hypothetical protein